MDFANLQNLSTLFLHHNPLVYISPLAFSHTPLLFQLDLSFTDLGHIPKAVLKLHNGAFVDFKSKPMSCSCPAMGYLKTWWNDTSSYIDATCNSGKLVYTFMISDLPHCP